MMMKKTDIYVRSRRILTVLILVFELLYLAFVAVIAEAFTEGIVLVSVAAAVMQILLLSRVSTPCCKKWLSFELQRTSRFGKIFCWIFGGIGVLAATLFFVPLFGLFCIQLLAFLEELTENIFDEYVFLICSFLAEAVWAVGLAVILDALPYGYIQALLVKKMNKK